MWQRRKTNRQPKMSSNVKAKVKVNRQPEKIKVKVKDAKTKSKRQGTKWSSRTALLEKSTIEIQVPPKLNRTRQRLQQGPRRRTEKAACTEESASSRHLDALLPMRGDDFSLSRRTPSQD